MLDPLVIAGVILTVALALLVKRVARLENRLNALSRLDAKLDVLLKHAGIQFDPYQDVPAAVIAALERGEKIQAIKDYRLATGAGLKEAKEFVEEIQRRKKAPV